MSSGSGRSCPRFPNGGSTRPSSANPKTDTPSTRCGFTARQNMADATTIAFNNDTGGHAPRDAVRLRARFRLQYAPMGQAERLAGWMRDRAAEAGANGFVVGLSGGIDSAVVA